MLTDNHFHNGLLLLSYLVIAADGKLDDEEKEALKKICEKENISIEYMNNFLRYAMVLPEKEVYTKGLEEIDHCSHEEKLRAFSWLYRISEVDGMLHVKEVRFLLYSLKAAGIDFDDILAEKEKYPSLL